LNKVILIIAGLILILFLAFSNTPSNSGFINVQNQITQPKRLVIFLMIDSLMDEPLQKAIKEERAPALEFLIQNGRLSERG
jgi:predicted AlkP superfamily pyrophosphatase or phosphodiesterase